MDTPKKKFLENAWYVGALSREVVGEELFHRKLLNQSVLFLRTKEDGKIKAMRNRCPHRFAPLHMGKRNGDEVSCIYHGLSFDCSGKCTKNPHGNNKIPAAMKVKTYPVEERDGFIWIWMGENEPNYDLLHNYFPLSTGHPNGVGHTYMKMPVHYELIIDNVMDLSHIDYLHGEIITTRGQLSPVTPKIQQNNQSINARWEWSQQPAMMIFANFLPAPTESARHYFDINWRPPANIQLSVGAVQGEKNFDEAISQYDLHTVTPETETSTHYFFATRRNHNEEDAEYNELKIQGMHDAFKLEDEPVVQAVQEEMGTTDFWSLNPVMMSNDTASVKVRRLLQKIMKEEAMEEDKLITNNL